MGSPTILGDLVPSMVESGDPKGGHQLLAESRQNPCCFRNPEVMMYEKCH